MILVTGASGHLGRGVAERLLERVPAGHVAVGVRDASRAADWASRGVVVRIADFADRSSLEAAFAGIDRLLVVSANTFGEEALLLHRNALEAAAATGVGRLFYTSHMGARVGSAFPPADQHARTEQEMAAMGVPSTALRHGFYAESCAMILQEAVRTGELRVPEDGPVSWTSRDDLAIADAALLMDDEVDNGPTPALTSSAALTMAEVAGIASEVAGREIRHTVVSDQSFRDAVTAAGVPPRYADLQLGIFQAARRGDFAATDPTLAGLLGREPTALRDVLARSFGQTEA